MNAYYLLGRRGRCGLETRLVHLEAVEAHTAEGWIVVGCDADIPAPEPGEPEQPTVMRPQIPVDDDYFGGSE